VSVNGGSVENFINKSQISQAIEIFYNSLSPYGESPIHLFCGPTITDSPNSTDSLLSLTVPEIYEIFYNSLSPYGESPIHLFCGPTITDSPNSTDALLSPTVPVALGVISTVIYRGKRLETEGYLTG
jgi:hypothetical protein